MPKEINKSPKAMEVILSQMYQPTEGHLIERYILGRVRSWFSLEIASFGGEVHFFIRAEVKYRGLIESAIYSQYPGVEVIEAEDYTYNVSYGLPDSDWSYFGLEYKLKKADAYPIKTYVDYGLDKDPKEEFKIDPLTPVLEFLGSLGPGEQVWYQIPIMAARKKYRAPGAWFASESWQDQARRLVNTLMKRDKAKDIADFVKLSLSPGERDVVEAIERGIGKYGFEAGLRGFYMAKGDAFVGSNIGRLLNSFGQFGSENLNGFKYARLTTFDYPWQDFGGRRLAYRKKLMFDNYRKRAYFYPPSTSEAFILNTEEIATMFHFPGLVAGTPTLGRIPSKRGEPPPNLPIG